MAERELQARGRVVVQEMAPVDMPLEDRADRGVQLSPHTWSTGRSLSMLARGFDDLDFAGVYDLDVAGALKSQEAQGAERPHRVNAFRPRRL